MAMNINYFLISYELEQMSKYLDLVQDALGKKFDQLEESYQKDLLRELSDDDAASLEDQYTDEFIEVGRHFPRLLLLSFVVSWYSFVEQKLIDLCERLDLTIAVRANDKENFDKGIRRARKFLIKGKNYSIDEGHWQRLTGVGKLRNIIVHTGKDIPHTYYKPDRQFVEHTLDNGLVIYLLIEPSMFQYLQQNGLVQNAGTRFEISPSFEYCTSLVDFAKAMFGKLYKDLTPPR